MARPERYQLPLLVELGGQRAEMPPSLYRGILDQLTQEHGESSRFVRGVQEEFVVHSPADAAGYLIQRIYTPFDAFDQEELWTLLLNTKHRITHEVMVYRGTLNSVHIRLAELFKEAIRTNAAAFILSHCHPSGDPTPSPEDIRLTEHTAQVAALLDVPLLDHIVCGREAWVSLKQQGLGFTR